jgi:hypothetical protein
MTIAAVFTLVAVAPMLLAALTALVLLARSRSGCVHRYPCGHTGSDAGWSGGGFDAIGGGHHYSGMHHGGMHHSGMHHGGMHHSGMHHGGFDGGNYPGGFDGGGGFGGGFGGGGGGGGGGGDGS